MKPMLAATIEKLEDVVLPVFVSPKLDGIRCLISNGKAVSRYLKPIPNKFIQECLKGLPDGLDGELMVEGDFNIVQSAVMSVEGQPNFCYYIFDMVRDLPFTERNKQVKGIVESQYFDAYPCRLVDSLEELLNIEDMCVKEGYEGIMLRSPTSPYKYGRSTFKEGYLLKYKRFKDSEAYVIGFEALNHNNNNKEKDALGNTVRSSKKIGLIKKDILGSLIVFDEALKVEFNIGTGFNQEQREDIWKNQKKYIGKSVTYIYQDVSSKGIPRFPSFKGFRQDVN